MPRLSRKPLNYRVIAVTSSAISSVRTSLDIVVIAIAAAALIAVALVVAAVAAIVVFSP